MTGITLDKSAAFVAKSTTCQLTPTVIPADAVNKAVVWSSSDKTIADVDANGLVNALSYGKATITATTQDGAKAAAAEITVSAGDLAGNSSLFGFTSLGTITADTSENSWGAAITYVGAASTGTNLEIAVQLSPQGKGNNLYILVDDEDITTGTSDPSFLLGWGSTGLVNTVANVDFAFAGYRGAEVLNPAARVMSIANATATEVITSIYRSQSSSQPGQEPGTATYKMSIPYSKIGTGAASGHKVHVYVLFGKSAHATNPTWGGIHSMFPVQSVLANPQTIMDTACAPLTLN